MSDIIINPSTGTGDNVVSVSSSTNEGVDKSVEYLVSTLDGKESRSLKVNQVGKRETFMVLNEETGLHEEFLLNDGSGFNVLKEEYSNG